MVDGQYTYSVTDHFIREWRVLLGGTYQFNHFIQISEYNMIYQATKLDENKKKIAIELLFIGFGGEITDRTQAPKLKIVWDK